MMESGDTKQPNLNRNWRKTKESREKQKNFLNLLNIAEMKTEKFPKNEKIFLF